MLNLSLLLNKSKVRQEIASKGFIQKDKKNEHSEYLYLSEAKYKKLFVDLFSKYGLELIASVIKVEDFAGTAKMPFGRRATVQFTLVDVATGEYEQAEFAGEGVDNGDKALYKAYTGALKYYFATTFNVPTGDDAEKETQDEEVVKASPEQIQIITEFYNSPEKLEKLCKQLKINDLTELTSPIASMVINKINEFIESRKTK